jgi:BirA family biotin operon repressor/biotin-[acetyl-CoA-carboxylase] ligase
VSDWPEGVDRVVLPEVDSTMSEATRRAPGAPTWILAHRQTAAHGRRGRAWVMPPGNFAASLIWRPGGDPAALALRSFTASLALHDALASLGTTGLGLKWPNDVLLSGGKLAGILLESPGQGRLILGVGLNLIAAPEAHAVEPGAVSPVSLLSETGLRLMPETLLDLLAPAFAAREAQLRSGGFAPVRADWLAHASRLGEVIDVRMAARRMRGTFDGIDANGHLLLGTADGPRAVPAADIFFEGAPAPSRTTGNARCS